MAANIRITEPDFDDGGPALAECETTISLASTLQWLEEKTEHLVQLLSQHGAVLFRGFPIRSAIDFDSFVTEFGWENFPYEKSLSNAVRVNLTDRVFTANEAPSDVEIFLHHEMTQTPIFPTKIFFCCLKAADSNGQTPICRSDVLLERLEKAQPKFVRDCEEKGLKYSNVMPGENDLDSGIGRSWQSTLSVQTNAEAESRLQTMGYAFEWLDGGSLRATTPALPAIRELLVGDFRSLGAIDQHGRQ